MHQTPLQLLQETAKSNAAADLGRGVELLREVATGARPPLLRLYVPAPTLAFGQRDARLEGFDAAWLACEEAGFTPVVRQAGGRAAAYHQGTLIVDHVQPEAQAMRGQQARFGHFGELFASALQGVGVDAAVGEIPGEYCPGEYSVHGTPRGGGQAVKLVGTAQRVVAGAWLFTSVVVVKDSAPLRSLTTDVYRLLGMPLDPAAVGAAEDLVPLGERVAVSTDAVAASILSTWAGAGYPAA